MAGSSLLSLDDQLSLVDHQHALDIIAAIAEPPIVTLTIDGASTIEITCGDATRKLLRDPDVATRATLASGGRTFELAQVAKTGDRYKLTFEDQVAAQLRRQTGHLVVKAGHMSREEFARKLAREAAVAIAVDPGHPEKVHTPLQRSVGGKTNSWDILGSDVASPINWRRFSDGTQLVIGGDAWLISRYTLTTISENTGAVGNIDFNLDTGKRASTATVTVDADQWALIPGAGVVLEDMGPADGTWLVQEFSRPMTSTRGSVTLTRAKHVLPEPNSKKKKPTKGKSGS